MNNDEQERDRWFDLKFAGVMLVLYAILWACLEWGLSR
jgi:hypothetical protein